ncbi:uncharacterized protein LOC142597562 [Dermatophagoides farinae]|uniref:uncharacterized protein LOC142597562 n=1 Tax=Dermatophagoides farinae TaxID=6954 RepID=UPI003F618142
MADKVKDNPTPEEISKLDEDIEDVYDQVENVVAFCPTDPSASTVKIYNEKILQIKKSSARVANKAEKWESKGLKNMEKLRGLLKTITEFEQRLGTYWQRIREALDKAEPTKEEMNISVSALEYFKRSRNQQTQAREDFSSWFNRSRSTAPPLQEISGRNVHGNPETREDNVMFQTPQGLTFRNTPPETDNQTVTPQMLQQVMQRLLETFQTPTATNMASTPLGQTTILPPIDRRKKYHGRNLDNINKFDGKARNFAEFIKSFDTFVGTTDIADDEKLVLLRKKLDEDSLNVVRGIENYEEAYTVLNKMYNNTAIVKRDIIQDIRALPTVRSYTQVDQMIKNLGVVRSRYNQLKKEPQQRTFLEFEFFSLVWNKFPKEVAEKSGEMADEPGRIHKFMKDAESYVQSWQKTLAAQESSNPTNETSRVRLHNTSVDNHYQSERESGFRTNAWGGPSLRQKPMGEAWRNNREQGYRQPQQQMATPGQWTSNRWQQQQQYFENRRLECMFCGKPHLSKNCPLTTKQRKQILIKEGRCIKCLGRTHETNQCMSVKKCFECGGPHTYLVCDQPKATTKPDHQQQTSQQPEQSGENVVPTRQNQDNQDNFDPSLLATNVKESNAPEGVPLMWTPGLTKIKVLINEFPCEALFDTGASHSFISDKLREKLNLPWVHQKRIRVNQANSACEAMGVVKVKLQMGVMKRSHLFFVLAARENVIIGVDVMKKFRSYRDIDGKVFQVLNYKSYRLDVRRSSGKDVRLSTIIIDEDTEEDTQRLKRKDQERTDQQVQEFTEAGLIQKSTSDYALPVVPVNKKDEGEETRLCMDNRKPNEVTVPERYPMPNIGDIVEKLLDASLFTTLNIASGFIHIPIAARDQRKTALVTIHEHFEGNVMPFRLQNAPAIFQRTIYNVLKKHNLTTFAQNYIDDIIVFSKTRPDHLKHLELVLEAMIKENIKLEESECRFMQEKVIYLGHEISKNTISPLHSNMDAILEYPAPTDKKTLRIFLGKINFYHRFIPSRTKTLDPFYSLLKKNAPFIWKQCHEDAFQVIKKIITSKLVLKIFDPGAETILITDASDVGIGAILKQKKDGQEETVGYFSRKLLPYQKNYVVSEKGIVNHNRSY